MSSEMRECPFCGNGAWVVRVPDTRRFRPQCKKCGADLGEFDREADAVAAWNRRALLARTEAGADGVEPFGWWIECHGTDGDFGQFVTDRAFVELLRSHGVVERETALFTHPQDASGDAGIREFTRDDLPPATHRTFIAPRGIVWCWVGHEVIDIVNKHIAAMQAKEAKS